MLKTLGFFLVKEKLGTSEEYMIVELELLI